MSALHVAIVGAGVGGLAAALSMHRKGIDVTVYEQAGDLGEVGAGVGLSYNSLRLLKRLDLGPRIREAATPMSDIRLLDSNGAVISAMTPAEIDRNLAIYRPDLISILTEAAADATIVTGRRCVDFAQDQDGATVVFADGTQTTADVVVAADGIHSTLQGHVIPARDPIFSGTIAYRGVLPADRVPPRPAEVGFGWMGDGRHFIVYPPFRGGSLINWAGIVPSDEEMRESWSLPGDPTALAAEFAGWDPALQEFISQVESTFRWGLYDRDPLPHWTNGRLTLLGDAAHPMLPHAGQGANQAIEDGVALATLLDGLDADEAPAALTRYETLRRPRTSQLQLAARTNGALYDNADVAQRGRDVTQGFEQLQGFYGYDVEAEAAALR